MIGDWRKRWGQGDFPFLLVQLAGWEPGGESWALLREAQWKAAQQIPKVGMATAIDIGHRQDIHPRNKQEVGRRLALVAQSLAYGEAVESSGPVDDAMHVEGDAVRLSFTHADGLKAKADPLTGFEVAGDDGKFVPAEASIEGDAVVLRCETVKSPRSARYDWSAYPDGNLINAAGLPAVPFRTDAE